MRPVRKGVVTVVAAGMLAACGGGGGSTGSGATPSAEKSPNPSVKAPKQFTTSRGWQQTVRWPDDAATDVPVGAAPEAGIVAFLQEKGEDYVVEAREAGTGALRWSSRPWQPPALGKDVAAGPSKLPQLLVVNDNGREYVAVWAYAPSYTKADTVSLLLYPADSSGKEISPARTVSLPVNAYEKPTVADGGNGILVSWEDDGTRVRHAAAIDLSTGRVTTYDKVPLPCGEEPCSTGSVTGLSPDGPVVQLPNFGGFGVPDTWHAGDAVPPGTRIETNKYNAGQVGKVLGGHVLSTWLPESGRGGLSVTAAHNLKSGKLVASVSCATESDGDSPKPALSPDGRYAVWDTVALDFEQGKAYCFDGGDEGEFVHLVSVADGMAYGYTQSAGESGRAPVAVTLGTGRVEELSPGTEIPSLLLPDTGGFSLELADGGARQFVFHPRR
ncbi:hypothetical protein ACFYT4_24925 [Streptomyces sp. NPDC004609]|uniref:hypothetical protein n=1 Tax=Streptomyces sp. NPDC004609 TaxID=3364704 RepID=UPI0036797AD1